MRHVGWILLAALGGCLDRTETITVRPDGSVLVQHLVQGDKGDLDGGAARYPDRHHFKVERRTEVNEDGDRREVLTARAEFESAADLPARFGAPDDPFGDRALRFSTEVTVRRENGRTYYRLVRVYEPRRWGDYEFLMRHHIPSEVRKMLEDGTDIEDMTDEEQAAAITGLVDYERGKVQLWADRALAAVANDHARVIDVRLAVRTAIADYFGDQVTVKRVRPLLEDSDEIDAFAARVYGELHALVLALGKSELGLDAAGLKRLDHELRANRHEFDVTDDLEDEKFTVRVELPGKTIAHNGDATEGRYVIWKFHGKDLRDHRHELIATSVVFDR